MEGKPVLSVADFCNIRKKIETMKLRPGAVMGRETPQIEIRSPATFSRVHSGTDYVKECNEEEMKRLRSNKLELPLDPNRPCLLPKMIGEMEDVTSIGSIPNLDEVQSEEDLKVYDTYDFTPKPVDRSFKLAIEDKQKKELLLRMIETNQVVIVVGATGCGKTTQLPQFILDQHAQMRKRCNIVVTQPRRIAARSVAARVCAERGWTLSTIVGYQVGLDNKTSRDTRITYCTTGVLREKLVRERNMLAYTHVIIDEIHERDLETDFLMLIVRKLLKSNSRTVKVILMSATIDPGNFAKYFSLPVGDRVIPAPIVDIDKSTPFEVKHYYLDQLSELLGQEFPKFDASEPCIDNVIYKVAVLLIMCFDAIDREDYKYIHKRYPTSEDPFKGTVLVFLPGIHEIETMYELLDKKSKEEKEYLWHLIPLHSSITKDKHEDVFRPAAANHRKIILSTNIAESSITVPGVDYVIDFCLTKHLMCDPVTNFASLRLAWASHANCKQRAGRTGRMKAGRVYRMVPSQFFENSLVYESDPEMTRCPLSTTVLKAKMLRMGAPKEIFALALDPPDLSRLESTIFILKEAGALLPTCDGKVTDLDGDITFLGTVMSHLPLDIHLSKMIMLGNLFSILDDTIVMAAWMTVRNVFRSDFHDRLGPYSSKVTFSGSSNSDSVAYLNVYRTYIERERTGYFRTSNDSKESWCKRQFLNYKAMAEANELVDELRTRLKNLGVYDLAAKDQPLWEDSELKLVRKVVIAGAFYPNYFVRGAMGGQVNEEAAVRTIAGKDPFSTVYIQGLPTEQPGELYAKAFKEKFEQYAGVVSNVSFDGSSKVYIEFQRDIESQRYRQKFLPGKISYPVYRAIKMRQLRIPIEIPILPEAEARNRAEKLGISTNRYLVLGKDEGSSGSRLPRSTVHSINFVPSFVFDPNRFYVHCTSRKELDYNQKLLNTPGNTFTLSEKPTLGEIYAAPFPMNSGVLYRAQVFAINKNYATVLFIDYGNVDDKMPLKYLCELGPKLQEFKSIDRVPPFALECTLTGIAPSALQNHNGVWSKAAVTRFHNLLSGGNLSAEVYSVVDGVLSLTVKQGTNPTSVNDILVEEGLAIKVEESYRSQVDNAVRSKSLSQSKNGGGTRHNAEISSSIDHNIPKVHHYVDPPSREECKTILRFRGPISPLEMTVFGTKRVAMGKPVSVDVDSVNSVLLDSNPEDPHERLLVAGYVSTNASGTKVKLGQTTLMPNIPGLAALMCFIFAPTLELRRNTSKTKYIGALCGLGCNPSTGEAYFAEHDMEIIIDCVFDLNDLQDVNRLRYQMSKPLMTAYGADTCEASPAEILECQIKIQQYFKKLINRPRPSQELETFPAQYKWHQYEDYEVLRPDFMEPRAPFQSHFALALIE